MPYRFREDARTLLWAFILFPVVPAIALIKPDLALWLFPASLYLAFCSGVLSHNHNHCPVFQGRRANRAYAAWLSIFYGFPTFAWLPTHNQNHHRYSNGEGDATRTTRHCRNNSLMAALTYPLRSTAWQLGLIYRYLSKPKAQRGARRRRMAAELVVLVGAHLAFFGVAVALHGTAKGALVYALSAGIPALFAPYSMMFTNYVQHVDCDPCSVDNHSRNFVSPFWNYLTFDNGYHTVHHERPGFHWSRYRALHEERALSIDPDLNQDSVLGYAVRTYVIEPLARALRSGTKQVASRI